jgi:hypothetical protein
MSLELDRVAIDDEQRLEDAFAWIGAEADAHARIS